jgi:hypothetical protein
MSDHPIPLLPGDGATQGPPGLLTDVTAALRAPDTVLYDGPGNRVIYRFTPDLSPADAATFDDLVRTFRTRSFTITLAEYQALKPALATYRSFRTQSDAAFTALTAAQRDAALRSAIFSLGDVLRALLRD